MIFKVRLLAETPLAYVAFKRPSARMYIRMRLEIPRGRERLTTHGTLVRLLLINANFDMI